MQPFDALTLRAVLKEAEPLVVNKKIDRIYQLGRDEVVVGLRARGGISHLLLSAHAVYGRVCLVVKPSPVQKPKQPNFCVLLRKHLTGATLVGVKQLEGERVVDLIFSCLNEVGVASIKVLTAEIMGRHSNLVLWERETEKILAVSHPVTRQMSRQRELSIGLTYARPPGQDRPNIFSVSADQFACQIDEYRRSKHAGHEELVEIDWKAWLLSSFSGLGRYLADELLFLTESGDDSERGERLWQKISEARSLESFKPGMKKDLSRYSVICVPEAEKEDWQEFPSANDLVSHYYSAQQEKERFQQLKERISTELRNQEAKINARVVSAEKYLTGDEEIEKFKRFGDLILSQLKDISPGSEKHSFDDLYGGGKVEIDLNPNMTPQQNAQSYYRKFAKGRARQKTATKARTDALKLLDSLVDKMDMLSRARSLDDLDKLKSLIFYRSETAQARPPKKDRKSKPKLLSVVSSDGWTIYLGRNRQENDQLINKLAKPEDVWMHVAGTGGAHVLIRVPSSGIEPPKKTLSEAAQLAARLTKASRQGKVRVLYTRCKHVRKIAGGRAGAVRYEMEKTLEVDTTSPMPEPLKKLFSERSYSRKKRPSRPKGSR